MQIEELAAFLKKKKILLFLDNATILGSHFEGSKTLIEKMYSAWFGIFFPFVRYGGLFVAGNSMDMSGIYRTSGYGGPCNLFQPTWKGFNTENIKTVMKETNFLRRIQGYMESKGILEYFTQQLEFQTGGIPFLVEKILRDVAKQQCVWKTESKEQEMNNLKRIITNIELPLCLAEISEKTPPIYKYFLVYLLFLCAYDIKMEKSPVIKLPHWIKKDQIFRIGDILNEVDCYFLQIGMDEQKREMKIVFPPLLLKTEMQIKDASDVLIQFFINSIKTGIKEFTDAGTLLAYMVEEMTRLKINYQMHGSNSKNFGEILPFLKKSFIGKMKIDNNLQPTTLNVQILQTEENKDQDFLKMHEMIKTATPTPFSIKNLHIDNLYSMLDLCPEDQILHFGPISFFFVKKYENLLVFQGKNTILSLSGLANEIQNANRIVESIENAMSQENTMKKLQEEIAQKEKEIQFSNGKDDLKMKGEIEWMKNRLMILERRLEIAKKFSNLKVTLVVAAINFDDVLSQKIGITKRITSPADPIFIELDRQNFQFSDKLEIIVLDQGDLKQLIHRTNHQILRKYKEKRNYQNFGGLAEALLE